MKVGDFVVERLHAWGVRHADPADSAAQAQGRPPRVKNNRGQYRVLVENLEGRAMAEATPVNPQRVIWDISPLLPANAIITSDSGSCANWFARDYRVQNGQLASLSGGLASMGAAVPHAIAAKFAHPNRPVIALVGDGAMQMNNMASWQTRLRSGRRPVIRYNITGANHVGIAAFRLEFPVPRRYLGRSCAAIGLSC